MEYKLFVLELKIKNLQDMHCKNIFWFTIGNVPRNFSPSLFHLYSF